MQSVFWTGKLSFRCKAIVNANCALSWLSGGLRDKLAAKQRVRLGYDGVWSDDVSRYEELGLGHYERTADLLLGAVDVRGKTVLDVGCGTGIVSYKALQSGAARVVGVDFSRGMLRRCCARANAMGADDGRASFVQLDAESLAFPDASFDVVMSSMLLGFLPDQQRALSEMARVVRPGGAVALTAHGPAHYCEACEAATMAVPKRYVLGYRFEMWFRKPSEVNELMWRAGLKEVAASSTTWQHDFASGREAYEFFASTSSAWWLSKIPPRVRDEESRRIGGYFEKKGVTRITSDVVLATGHKPT